MNFISVEATDGRIFVISTKGILRYTHKDGDKFSDDTDSLYGVLTFKEGDKVKDLSICFLDTHRRILETLLQQDNKETS